MSVQIARRHFNVAEYYRMAEAGILSEGDRVELIEGEIIKMSPIGARHAACVDRFNALLNKMAGPAAIVRVQNPIRLDDYSEPEPDLALLKPRADFYADSHPTSADVLLVIEVADTSVAYDRDVKIPLYARSGIPEAWLVNLPDDTVAAYSQPVNGVYQRVRIARRGESLESEIMPTIRINVDAILG